MTISPLKEDIWITAKLCLDMLNGKWKLLILKEWFQGKKRFKELERSVTGISQKVLNDKLKEMVNKRLVTRTNHSETPPKVEYELTPIGYELAKVVKAMATWGRDYQLLLDEKSSTL